jgi:hypothetical protein
MYKGIRAQKCWSILSSGICKPVTVSAWALPSLDHKACIPPPHHRAWCVFLQSHPNCVCSGPVGHWLRCSHALSSTPTAMYVSSWDVPSLRWLAGIAIIPYPERSCLLLSRAGQDMEFVWKCRAVFSSQHCWHFRVGNSLFWGGRHLSCAL